MKKVLVFLIVIVSFVLSTPAFAANAWYGGGSNSVAVVKVGCLPTGAAYAILTDSAGAFTNKGFIMQNSEGDKSGLATLLTAFSMGRGVSLYADVDAGTINIIVVKSE